MFLAQRPFFEALPQTQVLEAHILVALSPRTEHLVLIGDHMQLRPKTEEYALRAESRQGYNLDMSLFERLARLSRTDDGGDTQQPQGAHRAPAQAGGGQQPRPQRQLEVVTLSTQRRMRPSIAELVRKTLYPQLQDAPEVAAHPPVRGMAEPLFWWNHGCPEAGEEEDGGGKTGSKQNEGEADMVVALVQYIAQQVRCRDQRSLRPAPAV